MPVHNADIAAIFTEIAVLLEIEAANPFRIRAYRNAARVIGDLGVDVRTVIASAKGLTRLAGIGNDLAGKIQEITANGVSGQFARLSTNLGSLTPLGYFLSYGANDVYLNLAPSSTYTL